MGKSGGSEGRIRNAVLIAGPTASGKSALATGLAERLDGVIVNTDSMQVYSVLRVLTARPDAAELARAPHLLYGHIHPSTAYSTGAWLRDVARVAASGEFEGRRPIFVGGTGLYFRALLGGMSQMPDIPADIRAHWRSELERQGPERLHAILTRDDPTAAATLKAGDGQRIVRALEVMHASGRSILAWQAERGTPLVDAGSATRLVIEPDRPALVARIDRRFDAMVAAGAMEEARAIGRLELDPALPAMKAIGVPELLAASAEEISLDEAMLRAKTATRQYAKRQATWFRNQLGPEWQRLDGDAASRPEDYATPPR